MFTLKPNSINLEKLGPLEILDYILNTSIKIGRLSVNFYARIIHLRVLPDTKENLPIVIIYQVQNPGL